MRKVAKSISSLRIASVFLIAILSISIIYYLSSRNICANSISCIKNLTGQFEQNAYVGEFLGETVMLPELIAQSVTVPPILGETTTSDKRIEVDLSLQKLYAYEGGSLIYEFPVSTGKWGLTPTGEFRTWIKLRFTRMVGGVKGTGTYYNLPNVPYTMYFYNDQIPKWRGYGIHGAYWHNNFGHPMSHGCINMKIEDAEKLYHWSSPPSSSNTTYASDDSPGTKVIIYGTTPAE